MFLMPQAQLSSELMHNLSIASASLARFQQLAFAEARLKFPIDDATSPGSGLRPAAFPSPAPSPSDFQIIPPSNPQRQEHKPSLVESPRIQNSLTTGNEHSEEIHSPGSSIDSECCGGYMDCHGLVEEEDSGDGDRGDDDNPNTTARMSGMRFTSYSDPKHDTLSSSS
jgi:hypothetical protein